MGVTADKLYIAQVEATIKTIQKYEQGPNKNGDAIKQNMATSFRLSTACNSFLLNSYEIQSS